MRLKSIIRSIGIVGMLIHASVGSAYGQDEDQAGLTAEVLYESDAFHEGELARVAIRVRLNEGFHVNSNRPLDPFLIPTVLRFNPPEGIIFHRIAYPDHVLLRTGGMEGELVVFENEFIFGIEFLLAEGLAEGNYKFVGTLRYQACNANMCFPERNKSVEVQLSVVSSDAGLEHVNLEVFSSIDFSQAEVPSEEPDETKPAANVEHLVGGEEIFKLLSNFEILHTDTGKMSNRRFISFIEAAESGEPQKGLFEGKGPIAIVLIALIGGLLLNLTPCVLPMIPINIAIIGAGALSESRLRGMLLGATYGLAIALVYGLLGLIVVLSGSRFGAINSSPWFNLFIALIFLPLALAMFDIISIDFTRFQSRMNLEGKGRGTFLLAFFMGSVAAFLAGACVAPVVIAVVLFSARMYAEGHAIALVLPFLLGMGMALPWPAVGAGISVLPKPGAWTLRVKQIFGVFILVMACNYGYLAFKRFTVNKLEVASSNEEMLEGGWYRSLDRGLIEALSRDKLVLVDMWATWCTDCRSMNKTTLKDQEVLTRLEDYVKIKFQAENLNDPYVDEILDMFDSRGLPTYAILRPAY